MSTTTVRITPETRHRLRQLSEMEGHSMQVVLEKALRLYEERLFWERANRAYATLKADPKAWKQELEERAEWEATAADGLEEE